MIEYIVANSSAANSISYSSRISPERGTWGIKSDCQVETATLPRTGSLRGLLVLMKRALRVVKYGLEVMVC